MFKKCGLTAIAAVFTLLSVSAQAINTDSLSLVAKISEDQLKLAKLQNTVQEVTRAKADYAVAAQQSADKNRTAAGRLSDDATDKSGANKAYDAASDAKSDAKKARKASDKLKNLNKDIADLQDKIAKNQQKLNVYLPVPFAKIDTGRPAAADSTRP
jgi:uncharacterized coiled-coil protein SlyX